MASKKSKEVKQEKPKEIFGNYYDPTRTYEALKNASLLPEWAKQAPWDEGAAGQYIPSTNSLIAREPLDLRFGSPNVTAFQRSTLSHEMSHSAQTNLFENMASAILEREAKGIKTTPQEQQFVHAVTQLFGAQYGSIGQYDQGLQNALDISKRKQTEALYKNKEDPYYDAYRMSSREAQAHGIGAMTLDGQHGSKREYKYNPHLDPTFATEFDTLLSMYQGLPKGIRTLAEQKRLESINKERSGPYQNKQRKTYDFENVFADPFAPTIK